MLFALTQDQHDQAIEAEQGHSGKRHDGEAVRCLRDAGAGRCGRCLAGFCSAGCAVGSGIAVVAIAVIGFAGGRRGGSGLLGRGRGRLLGRGGLLLGFPADCEGRQAIDGYDQLAILQGGLQQFGGAVVLQVGDQEVVVACILGLDVGGQVEGNLQALLGEVLLGDFLTGGTIVILDTQGNFVDFDLDILDGLLLGDLLFQGRLDLFGGW